MPGLRTQQRYGVNFCLAGLSRERHFDRLTLLNIVFPDFGYQCSAAVNFNLFVNEEPNNRNGATLPCFFVGDIHSAFADENAPETVANRRQINVFRCESENNPHIVKMCGGFD